MHQLPPTFHCIRQIRIHFLCDYQVKSNAWWIPEKDFFLHVISMGIGLWISYSNWFIRISSRKILAHDITPQFESEKQVKRFY